MDNHINDLTVAALNKEGFGDDYNGVLDNWFKSEGATSWDTYWTLQGVPAGNYNDRYSTWLLSLGFNQGDLDGQQFAYWLARATA